MDHLFVFIEPSFEAYHCLWVRKGVEASGEAENSRMGGTMRNYRVLMSRTKT